MTKIGSLERRLEKVSGGGDVWIPQWLADVGSREEVAEWKAILQSRRRQDQGERRLEFQRKMRAKYPEMPLTFEEQLEEEVRKLKEDKDLRRREGITEEMEETPCET